MPTRKLIARELSDVMKVLAHPDRIRLIEELRAGEVDVNALHERLDLPSTRVSQHLAILRAHRLVAERRDGRRHLYSLAHPRLPAWILEGADFIEARANQSHAAQVALGVARQLWAPGGAPAASSPPSPDQLQKETR